MNNLISIIPTIFMIMVRSLFTIQRLQNYDYHAVFKAKPLIFDLIILFLHISVVLPTEYLLEVGSYAYSTLSVLGGVILIVFYLLKRSKVRFTARCIRLFIPQVLVVVALSFVLGELIGGIYGIYALITLCFFAPRILTLINGIIAPLERRRNFKYAYEKTAFLRNAPFPKIVISGSFGKTSCKNILSALLSEKYQVQSTLGNFNTPLGIVKSLEGCGKEWINGKNPIFIAEGGARRVGDIWNICKLIEPTYGILTGVCAQHLDTFKNIEVIKRAKGELPKFIGKNGCMIFNGDNEPSKDIIREFDGEKYVVGGKNGDFIIENLKIDTSGTSFDLVWSGGILPLKTCLLGRHNALNLAFGVALSLVLGVSEEHIKRVVDTLTPTEHRLQPITSNGITIIDDSYNGNEEGVMSGLEVISTHPGRKVIYAQGVVECGSKKRDINQRIGGKIGEIADIVMLSGENSKYLESGIRACGNPKIYKFKNIMHAKGEFKNILRQGDILYIQNDIP